MSIIYEGRERKLIGVFALGSGPRKNVVHVYEGFIQNNSHDGDSVDFSSSYFTKRDVLLHRTSMPCGWMHDKDTREKTFEIERAQGFEEFTRLFRGARIERVRTLFACLFNNEWRAVLVAPEWKTAMTEASRKQKIARFKPY